MSMTEPPGRGEFDLLRQIVATIQIRVDAIDVGGTKGVAVVQAQLTDLAKDVVRLEADLDKRFDEHVRVHVQDQRDRVSGRRWMLGTVVAALTVLVAILGLTLNLAAHMN